MIIIKIFFSVSYYKTHSVDLDENRATITEDEIKEAFTSNGFEVKAFKFFP
jgi:polypyrimidine tract-binding protein 1